MKVHTYKVVAMLEGDHSNWKTLNIKAKNEEIARGKAEKQLAKIAKIWEIDSIEEVQE